MASSREPTERYTSAGSLPRAGRVQEAVDEAWRRFHDDRDGAVSTVYPALASVDPDRFGIAVVGVSGTTVTAGDAHVEFTVMSVAKPVVLALVGDDVGMDRVRDLVGVNATGMPFNAMPAVDGPSGGRTNPMVNAGAIATTSLVAGVSLEDRWERLRRGLARFAGRALELDGSTLDSALATNHRNRALANLLASAEALHGDPAEAVELYTRQSCLAVTAVDLAVMGATLADGGVNPVTGDTVVTAETAQAVLAMMTVAGSSNLAGHLVDRS